MGYRSNVLLKTTTEGYILMRNRMEKLKKEDPDLDLLRYAEISKTKAGFYKIEFTDIKWYDSYKDVNEFMNVLTTMDEQDIPYSFIRIGEETEDIEWRRDYPDDMPEEVELFEPIVDVDDPDRGGYEVIKYEDGEYEEAD